MKACTIIRAGAHYDTKDERFYSDTWECTLDDRQYLEQLMSDNPQKFFNCQIIINL